MIDFRNRYQAGVNLGGWISQYGEFDHDHFERFVDESDTARIADWGMDHVRLPVDYPVLDGDTSGAFDDRGFGYVDDCLRWCDRHDLDVVLDLHEAPGYSFNDLESNRLFDEPALRDRFVDLWREFARRYESAGDEVVFELLNEVVEPTSERWNALAHRTVNAIHEIDPDRCVLVGSNKYNSPDELANLELGFEGPVAYTFHLYDPFLFTHQHASWTPLGDLSGDIEYPTDRAAVEPLLEELAAAEDEVDPPTEESEWTPIDRSGVEAAVEPAVEFRAETGAALYCGEYGAIDQAPARSRVRWCDDVVDILSELGIGRACWSYKEMNFGLVDGDGDVTDDDVVDIVSRT